MDKIATLHAFHQLKVLADARRLEILRLLMVEPATLTQLGLMLKKSPGWVRHHLKALETVGLVELVELVISRGNEKYYQAKAPVLFLPECRKPVIVFSGSQDAAIDHLACHFASSVCLLIQPGGSLDSLINLRQGGCHLAGVTRVSAASDDDNMACIRLLFQDRRISIVTLAHRTQGLIVAPGNPKNLKTPSDLAREDVALINRNPGSGTRLWLDRELTRLGHPGALIRGYGNFVNSHRAAAETVQAGEADVAIGLQSAAYETQTDFIPLFEERYDLIIPSEQTQLVSPLLDYLQTSAFRQALSALTGYNTAQSGKPVLI
jgi:putative molybdopterin biosynthesis protein